MDQARVVGVREALIELYLLEHLLGDLAIGLQDYESDGDCRNSRGGLSHNQKLVLRYDCLVNHCAHLAVSGLRVGQRTACLVFSIRPNTLNFISPEVDARGCAGVEKGVETKNKKPRWTSSAFTSSVIIQK